MQSISSRYSLTTISSNIYQQFLTGTTTPNLSVNISLDPLEQGYVYAPYIMVQSEPTINGQDWREWKKQKLKEIRIEKLQKIKNITI